MAESTAASITDKKAKGVTGNSLDGKLTVYVWDMDETLILLKSLLNGTYAEAFNGVKNVQEGVEIGKMWEKHILDLCDNYFFYEQIENYNKPFLSLLREYDDGRDLVGYDFNQDAFGSLDDDANKRKLAYRHRVIAENYKKGLNGVLDQELMKQWDELYNMTDKYTDGWLSSAHTFLEKCSAGKEETYVATADGITNSAASKSQHVNVLVTSGSLIPSLVKCLLFRFDNIITHENVYSSWDVGKPQCFQWIKERFNSSNVRFCVIGDGWEECEAAEIMQWPFIKIDPRPGCTERFPGLTLKTIGFYLSVVYGNSDPEDD
ncbi:eyes absent homolog isoform X1 [Humulus lupulus]|uniref:eyes absent homolog isoform X1 n=1 Tax=Humulus lupulus TaxID=3486 RepID=UPI002B40C413|nr:eyes absent homolog isoform X1 [Humulus lupulus]XP_062073664.1 eyes absent homolog isoform X1 [Humulus lupulus]